MEPIQDDIETLRRLLTTKAFSFDDPTRADGLAALDRLVAERDRLRRIVEAARLSMNTARMNHEDLDPCWTDLAEALTTEEQVVEAGKAILEWQKARMGPGNWHGVTLMPTHEWNATCPLCGSDDPHAYGDGEEIVYFCSDPFHTEGVIANRPTDRRPPS